MKNWNSGIFQFGEPQAGWSEAPHVWAEASPVKEFGSFDKLSLCATDAQLSDQE
jgi:hypothetical protein